MKKVLIWVYCNIKLILSPFKSRIKILRDNELIEYVKKNNLSIIRYGDGEFKIIQTKKGIHFQDFNENLYREMRKIFFEYSKDSKYILCVPYFLNENILWYKTRPYAYTACFAKCRLYFRKNYKKDVTYGDAFVFKKNNKEIYEKLWKDEKHIILVHNDIKWAKALENKYNMKVDFIEIPSKNSYDVIDNIESQIKEINKEKDKKILISAGPMAKALTYRLIKEGFTVYDTGHCFDEPLEIVNDK